MNEGDLIPNITLRSVDSDGIQNFNLVENFQNKKCHSVKFYTLFFFLFFLLLLLNFFF